MVCFAETCLLLNKKIIKSLLLESLFSLKCLFFYSISHIIAEEVTEEVLIFVFFSILKNILMV